MNFPQLMQAILSQDSFFVRDSTHQFKLCTDFLWNNIVTGEQVCDFLISAYDEVIHWRPNVFLIPYGKAGKHFIKELARLYQAFAEDTALSSIALMALLLQKPHKQSKVKDHSTHLLRRLELWNQGSFDALLKEGRCIQDHLKRGLSSRNEPKDPSRLFDHLMSEGKVSMALRLLSEKSKGGVLSLDSSIPSGFDSSGKQLFCTVREILMEKHPTAIPASPSILLDSSSETQHYDPIIFDCITGDVIKKASLNTHGAAGPSGVDADAWRRMCTSFGEASVGLCEALASVARRLCAAHLVPLVLMPFLSCRLIPLDKCPGIGIGDVPCRIVSKAVLYTIGDDIVLATGPLQTCAGHEAGSEAAVHAMKELFGAATSEATLLVDATNALTVSIVKLHFTIFPRFVHLFLSSCRILIVPQSVFLLLVKVKFHLLRAQRKVTPCYGHVCTGYSSSDSSFTY